MAHSPQPHVGLGGQLPVSSQGTSAYSATSGAPLNPTSQQPHCLPVGCRGGRRGAHRSSGDGAGAAVACVYKPQGTWSKFSVNSSCPRVLSF